MVAETLDVGLSDLRQRLETLEAVQLGPPGCGGGLVSGIGCGGGGLETLEVVQVGPPGCGGGLGNGDLRPRLETLEVVEVGLSDFSSAFSERAGN
jgi:hypothetical protein